MKSVALLAVGLLVLVLSGCAVVSGRPEAPLRNDQMAQQIEITQKKIICGLNNRKVEPKYLSPATQKKSETVDPENSYYFCEAESMEKSGEYSYRNDVIVNALLLIDINYQGFINDAGLEQRKKDIGVDVTTLSLNLAGAAVGATQAKTILAAVSAGVLGTNTSFDKTFVYEQTIPTLLAQMNADRSDIYSRIVKKMRTLDFEDYSMQEAIHDLIDYYNAGTLQGAIISIRKNAGGKQADSEKKAQDQLSEPIQFKEYNIVTNADVVLKKKINDTLSDIGNSPNSLGVDVGDLAKKIKAALGQYNGCDKLPGVDNKDTIEHIRIFCLDNIGGKGESYPPIIGLQVLDKIFSDGKIYEAK